MIFFAKRFCSVFELPSLRNTRKRDKTKKVEEKLSSKFLVEILEKGFDMDFLQKYMYGVFELPLPRNAQKRTKKKSQEKKSRMVGGWVGDLVNVRGGPSIFFGGPSIVCVCGWAHVSCMGYGCVSLSILPFARGQPRSAGGGGGGAAARRARQRAPRSTRHSPASTSGCALPICISADSTNQGNSY
jgi:hypothetical protein